MSDVSFSDLTLPSASASGGSWLDTFAPADPNSQLGDLPLGMPGTPGTLTSAGGSPLLTVPQSLAPAGGNVLDSITRLVGSVYQGEAQNAYAKGAVRAQQIDAATRGSVAQAMPTNFLLIGALVLGGVVLFHSMDGR